jgi:hypothetical protein
MTAPAPKGWLPDPSGNPNLERYWNGEWWGQQRRKPGVKGIDPVALTIAAMLGLVIIVALSLMVGASSDNSTPTKETVTKTAPPVTVTATPTPSPIPPPPPPPRTSVPSTSSAPPIQVNPDVDRPHIDKPWICRHSRWC